MKHILLTICILSSVVTMASGLNSAQAASPWTGWQPALSGRANMIRVGEKNDFDTFRKKGGQPAQRSPDDAKNAIVANLQTEFEKAAGSSDHILTKQDAVASGWGWGADHFDAIDSQNKGGVTLDDVLNYVSRTARVTLPRRKASTQTLQVVH